MQLYLYVWLAAPSNAATQRAEDAREAPFDLKGTGTLSAPQISSGAADEAESLPDHVQMIPERQEPEPRFTCATLLDVPE